MREQLGIIITTFNRASTAIPTIESFKKNMLYDEGRRFWVIADDGSPEGYVDSLRSLLKDETVFVTNSQRQGVGKSKNLALQLAFNHTQTVFLSEDDWVLREPLDCRPFCDTLVSFPQVGMIRAGYLSVPTHNKYDLVGYCNMSYIRMLPHPEDMYTYSGQCSFRSQNFYHKIGWHGEGLTPGQEELDMCRRYNALSDPPEILWPGIMGFHYQTSYFVTNGEGHSLNNVQPENTQ